CRGSDPPAHPSFPTRRSSDLRPFETPADAAGGAGEEPGGQLIQCHVVRSAGTPEVTPSWAGSPSMWRSSRATSAFISRRSTIARSEEHTSELQSRENLVCRLL